MMLARTKYETISHILVAQSKNIPSTSGVYVKYLWLRYICNDLG